jgi:hypothetical protein
VGSGIEAGRAASSVMGASGLSFAGSGGAGAYRVDRHIALQVRQYVMRRWEYGGKYHSRSSTERVSASGLTLPPSPPPCDEVPTVDISVTSRSLSLASARRNAGFFAFGKGRAAVGTTCLRFRMQNIHRLYPVSLMSTLVAHYPLVNSQRRSNSHNEDRDQEREGCRRHATLPNCVAPFACFKRNKASMT